MELFKIGQTLAIYFQKNSNIVEITCTIEDLEDDRLYVELPPYFMRYIEFLQTGCRLTAKVFTKFGTIDFNTIVISSPLSDRFCLEFDPNSYKLTPGVEMPKISAIEKLLLIKDDQEYSYRTIEIASEYLLFTSNDNLKVNDVYKCVLTLPDDYGIIKFKGKIDSVDKIYTDEYKLSYLTLPEEERQKILYYMYIYEGI